MLKRVPPDGSLSVTPRRRPAHAVDATVLEDLKALLGGHNTGKQKRTADGFLPALYPAGLARMLGGKEIKSIGDLYFEISPSGNKLITAYHVGCKLCKKRKG